MLVTPLFFDEVRLSRFVINKEIGGYLSKNLNNSTKIVKSIKHVRIFNFFITKLNNFLYKKYY